MMTPDTLAPIPMYSGGQPLPLPPLKHGQKAWTEKEIRFRDLYLFSNNVVDSYVQAGYTVGNKSTAQLQSAANRHLRSPRIQDLLNPAYSVIEISPESLKRTMAERLRHMPPAQEWSWDHWLKMYKLAMQNAGMLKEAMGGTSIGTMNLINISTKQKEVEKRYPTTPQGVRKLKEEKENPPPEVIDVQTMQ